MRLIRLRIDDYLVLQNLEIVFDPSSTEEEQRLGSSKSYALDFLVGVNGTGKSTVLRALALIFANLERSIDRLPFKADLEYELVKGGAYQRMRITNCPWDEKTEPPQAKDKPIRVYEDGSLTGYKHTLPRDLLPEKVIIYTTGSHQDWTEVLEGKEVTKALEDTEIPPLPSRLEDRFIAELPGHLPQPEQERPATQRQPDRLLMIQSEYLSAISLSGLLVSIAEEGILEKRRLYPVLKDIGVERVSGFSLRCRVLSELTTQKRCDLVDQWTCHATTQIQQGSDRLLVYDLTRGDTKLAQYLIEEFGTGLALFESLVRLQQEDEYGQTVLQEVNIFLERSSAKRRDEEDEVPLLHLLDWMSDGERSFLGRMALFTILGTQDTLVLLDEPEVHFNDVWKRQIVNVLDEVLRGYASHALISTHSSIALTDVLPEDIIVLERRGTKTDTASQPRMQTFGADPSDIMVHVFNAPQATGAHSVDTIQNLLRRASRGEVAHDELGEKLRGIAPGYWSYRIRREMLRLGVQ